MTTTCSGCGRKSEGAVGPGGTTGRCVTCGAALVVSEAPTVVDDSRPPATGNVETFRFTAEHVAMTIPQYMAEKDIEGGVELQNAGNGSPASSLLAAEQGLRYKVGKLVAKGGMGAILDARDVNLRRGVAMKVMLAPDRVKKEEILRFIQEAQVTSQLEHPSIVPVHELGVDPGGNLYYTMKFVKGRTLSEILKKIRIGDKETIKAYPLTQLLTIFQKICDAMAFAHSKGVLHRDLKPENVMVGDYGEVQVMDWGLAKVLPAREWREVGVQSLEIGKLWEGRGGQGHSLTPGDGGASGGLPAGIDSVRDSGAGDAGKTMDGLIMGTPEFMSPEQALGNIEEIDERTDIYALGAILFNILTLNAPVEGKTPAEVIEKVSAGRITKPTSYNEKVPGAGGGVVLPHMPDRRIPDSLCAVAMRALEFEPHRRYRTVKELQREIEAYQGGFATKAEKAGAFKQSALFIKRNKAAAVGVAAVVIVAAVFGSRAMIEGRRAQQALEENRETAPGFAAQAGVLLKLQKPGEALEQIGYAIKLNGTNAEYRLFRAHVLQALVRLPEAVTAYGDVLALRPDDAVAALNLELCRKLLAENGGNPVLSSQLRTKLADALVAQKREGDAVALRRELFRETHSAELTIRSRLGEVVEDPGLATGRLQRLQDGTFHLDLRGSRVIDLGGLKGLPVSSLDVSGCTNVNLAPLRELSLKVLIAREVTGVDFDNLRGLKLQSLDLAGTGVVNLSFLQGMPLQNLDINACSRIRDLSPLAGCTALESLLLPSHLSNIAFLRKLPNLKRISSLGMMVSRGFWDRIPPADDFWLKNGERLERQVLMEEKLESFRKSLVAQGNDPEKVPRWAFDGNGQLTISFFRGLNVTDISGLKGVAVTRFQANSKDLCDLSPLAGAPLSDLVLMFPCGVTNLSMLSAAPLQALQLFRVQVRDISFVRKMPLKMVSLQHCPVTDVSPLAEVPTLEWVLLPVEASNVETLRHHPRLGYIAYEWSQAQHRPNLTASEFWRKYDAGDFRK